MRIVSDELGKRCTVCRIKLLAKLMYGNRVQSKKKQQYKSYKCPV